MKRLSFALALSLVLTAVMGIVRGAAPTAGSQPYTLFLFTSPRVGLEPDYQAHFVRDAASALLSLKEVQSVQQFRILDRHLIPGAKPYQNVLRVELSTAALPSTLQAIRQLRDQARIFERPYLADVVRPGVFYGEGTFMRMSGPRHASASRQAAAGKPYSLMLFANAKPGSERAFNQWYDSHEIPALLKVAGVQSVQRFMLAPEQLRDPRAAHKYLYSTRVDLVTNDIDVTLDALQSLISAGQLLADPSLDPDQGDGTLEAVSDRYDRQHPP